MKCRHCGAELQMGEQFCYRCGNAIEDKPQRHCGYCGAQLEEGASFCFKCGRATLAKRGRGSAPTADAAEKGTEEKARLRVRTEELVWAAQGGDGNSFTELYRLYYPKVFALAKVTVKSEADAEDVLQMTFLKAWDNLDKLKNPAAFSTWIQRITLNQCYSLLRKRHIDVSIDEDDEENEPIQLQSDLMLPEVYAERSDLKARLGKIIRELSAVQQQTITLYYYDELPVENIAWIMDCGVNTVKSRLFLARKSIKTEIEEQERKSGQVFYGVMGLGLVPFGTLFGEQVEAAALSKSAAAALLKGIAAQIGSTAAKEAVAGEAVGHIATREAAKAGVDTAAKVGAKTAVKAVTGAVSKKIMTGIVATVLAVGAVTGGTVAAVHAVNQTKEEAPRESVSTVYASKAPEKPHDDDIVLPHDRTPQLSQTEREAYRAYLELLEREKAGIDNYIWQRGYTLFYDDDYELIPLTDANRSRPVALCDVYGDDLPELIYVGDADEGQWNDRGEYYNDYDATLHIVTYRDGRLITLYEDVWDGWGDSWNSYHMFQISGSKDLYARYANGDLSFWDVIVRFSEDADGRLKESQVCQYYSDDEADMILDGALVREDHYYAEEGHEISKEAYEALLQSLIDSTKSVWMFSILPNTVEPLVQKNGCPAMTADEAITYLKKLLQEEKPEADADTLQSAYGAYKQYLTKNRDAINNFVWQSEDWTDGYEWVWNSEDDPDQNYMVPVEANHGGDLPAPRAVALCDIVGDAIPELICVQVDDISRLNYKTMARLVVLTYRNGTLLTLYDDDWGTLNEYEGSFESQLFAGSGKNKLIAHWGDGMTLYSEDHYSVFTEGPDGLLRKTDYLEEYHLEADGEDDEDVDSYTGTEGEIDPATYAQRLSVLKAQCGDLVAYCGTPAADQITNSRAMTLGTATAWLDMQIGFLADHDLILQRMPTKFWFASGVGAWATELTIQPNGRVIGYYHDADAGSAGNGYDGTLYYSNFVCWIVGLKKINSYTYEFRFADVSYVGGRPGDEEIRKEGRERTLYVFTECYGVVEGWPFELYTDAAPIAKLPEGYVENCEGWAPDLDKNTTLPFYGMYSEEANIWYFSEK